MKSVGIREFVSNFRKHVEDMGINRESITITDRNTPIAILSPLPSTFPEGIIPATSNIDWEHWKPVAASTPLLLDRGDDIDLS